MTVADNIICTLAQVEYCCPLDHLLYVVEVYQSRPELPTTEQGKVVVGE